MANQWVNVVLNTTFESDESRTLGHSFQPQEDDVIISTPAKCGTTWMQQIVHGLRSGGSMDFEDMSMVIPCMEFAHSYGYVDLDADQGYLPRVYKTHFYRRDVPKGAGTKYIVIVRDPVDAAASFYNMFVGWVFPPGDCDIQTFLEAIYLPRDVPSSHLNEASIWQFILSWYPHRSDANVLFLHYEDMLADLPLVVKLVADFLQLGHDDPGLQEVVVKQASFDFMKQHAAKFNERALKLARNEANGLPRMAGLMEFSSGKIRKGAAGSAKEEMPPELLGTF